MPIRPRGDPEVLVVRGKPTGPTGSLLHDRASLYSSNSFLQTLPRKNKTETKQNFVYRFSKSVNKTADKSQKDNECVSNLQQYNFFASKIENQKKKLHEAMPPQIVLVNKQLILMC